MKGGVESMNLKEIDMKDLFPSPIKNKRNNQIAFYLRAKELKKIGLSSKQLWESGKIVLVKPLADFPALIKPVTKLK